MRGWGYGEVVRFGAAALAVVSLVWAAPPPGSPAGFREGARAEGKSRWKRGSEKNQKDCETWCKEHEGTRHCARCSRLAGCGVGYSLLKSFKGRGRNWHACRRNAYGKDSDANHDACDKWCKKTTDCVKCSRKSGCGPGLSNMKSFRKYKGFQIIGALEIPTYPGKTWFACKRRTTYRDASDRNRARCEAWCKEEGHCAKCSKLRNCGSGYKRLKYPGEDFRGQGHNWYPCERR